ncbi:hypothetical protein BDP27DRAFT_1344192 [Rhodocollybia butyracea]|uniref:DUF6534 domain-containing protein n=1 Tax=Rhodocollybia butyracea TaxID=206335 RepID=A0A9P5TYE0_9AGAR|nr:hypothetical protein BDP27DRAFT_1344192 [Rhodocollybia butyracea]
MSTKSSLGAIIVGFPLALVFSGILIAQTAVYFRSPRHSDTWRTSLLVVTFLFFDLLHSILLWNSAWEWFITEAGNNADLIPTAMALTILVTGISTFVVHSVYSRRIFCFSGRNYWITVPIVVLAALRVVSATVTTVYMIKTKSFERFKHEIAWVFTTGLALSCAVDILIAGIMIIILKQNRAQSSSLHSVIDLLILYTLETGSITAIATIAASVTWLTVSLPNLSFLGLYFIIVKLYANTALAMLNSRTSLRQAVKSTVFTHNPVDLEILSIGGTESRDRGAASRSGKISFLSRSDIHPNMSTPLSVEVNVTKTMHNDIGYSSSFTDKSDPNSQGDSENIS